MLGGFFAPMPDPVMAHVGEVRGFNSSHVSFDPWAGGVLSKAYAPPVAMHSHRRLPRR
jgi:hypothetical protein